MNTSTLNEAAARRLARRHGFRINKSRGHDGYMIIDDEKNFVVAGSHPIAYAMDLVDVSVWLQDYDRLKPLD